MGAVSTVPGFEGGGRQEGAPGRRVVVTGMGIGTALGFSLNTFWKRLMAGESGLNRHPQAALQPGWPSPVAGWIRDEELNAALEELAVNDPDRANQLALFAVGSALRDAGWPIDGKEPLPHDVILGTGHGNVGFNNEAMATFVAGGYRKIRPTTVVRLMFNRPSNLASIRFRLTGTSFVVSSACATGAIAVGQAFHRVRHGYTECAVAACADTGLDVATFSAWNRLGVLSKNPVPALASRPFDRDRDGLVMGEGAAGLVLESLESATRRGARIYGEILGFGTTCDAAHLVQPDVAGQVRALRSALADAGMEPGEIGYVNAHGTATELADKVEAASLLSVFGNNPGPWKVSNTKAQLGHLMGATAGVELVVTLLGLSRGQLPACRNLDNPDPECDLPFIREPGWTASIDYAVKNSFAFGGTNCALVLGRLA